MSFLQPWMLFALPLIALPIIIHLINQRRYQSVPWAAMVFLLTANKMSTGYARLRRYLILAARTLAVAGLVFAVARPLSSGWLGIAVGSRVDTTILIFDRSPSMGVRNARGQSKLEGLTEQLIDSLGVVRSNRYVWISDDANEAVEMDSLDELRNLKVDQSSGSTSDIATLLETASGYVRENQPSSVEIWIVSDMRKSDWSVASGRWSAINQSIRELPQSVRLHLLTSDIPPPLNRSLRVTSARRSDDSLSAPSQGEEDEIEGTLVESPGGPELRLSLTIQQHGVRSESGEYVDPAHPTGEIPISLDLDGAKSEFFVKLTGDVTEVSGLTIPLDAGMASGNQGAGWGSVSLPADANQEDNQFFFAYGEPTVRRTIVVCEDAVEGETEEAKPLLLAAGIPPDAETRCICSAVTAEDFLSEDLQDVALVLWTESLPDESTKPALESFLARGGRVIFFAPNTIGSESFDGLQWGDWVVNEPAAQISTWIGDHDLLSSVRSGDSLPVGEIQISRHRPIQGSRLPLAYLPDENPLLARSMGDSRGVYLVSTNIEKESSTLASNGVVLYAMIQRALADGAATLGSTRQLTAGETDVPSDRWTRRSGANRGTSNHYSRYSGVYSEDERLIAVNRGEAEDTIELVSDEQLERIFAGLDFDRIRQESESSSSLVQEIWRLFLTGMLIALLCEAMLCLPRIKTADSKATTSQAGLEGWSGT